MNLDHYLGFLARAESELAGAFREVIDRHGAEAAVFHVGGHLADQSESHIEKLKPFIERYGDDPAEGPAELRGALFGGDRDGSAGLLRDLHDLYVLAAQVDMSWVVVSQAAQGLRDGDLYALAKQCETETATQMRWLRTQLKTNSPQTLVVG